MAWTLYEKKPEVTEESLIGKGLRNAAGVGADLVEGTLGLPGNVADFVGSAAVGGTNKLIKAFGGKGGKSYQQIKDEGLRIPTSGDVRNYVTEPVSKVLGAPEGYLEPKGYGEEKFRNIAGKAAPAIISAAVTGGLSLAGAGHALGASAVGELAKEGVRVAGGGETLQNIADIGGMVGYGLAGTRKALKQQMNLGFDKQKEIAQAEGLKGNPSNLRKKIEHKKSMLNSPSNDIPKDLKHFVNERYDAVLSGIKEGEKEVGGPSLERARNAKSFKEAGHAINKPIRKIEELAVDKAVDMRRKVNSWFDNQETPKGAEAYLKRLNGTLGEFIENSGKKSPEFIKYYNESNELHGAMQKGFNYSDVLHKALPKVKNQTLSKIIEHGLTPAAYAVGAYGLNALGGVNGLAATILAGLSAKEAYKLQQLVSHSPTAAKVYTELLKGLASKNTAIVTARAKQLDSIMNRSESD